MKFTRSVMTCPGWRAWTFSDNSVSDLVVIPHWNNAEDGTHDTRFCFMGEPRFRRLESLIPEEVPVL